VYKPTLELDILSKDSLNQQPAPLSDLVDVPKAIEKKQPSTSKFKKGGIDKNKFLSNSSLEDIQSQKLEK